MLFISEAELKKYGKTDSLSQKAIALVDHQKANWKLASDNYRSLKLVQTRNFEFGHFRVVCQFNPGRIRSSSANTSAEAILSRPCFLCGENLPREQFGIPFGKKMTILTNPYPIFPYHLTIPSTEHIPQQIEGNLESLNDLGRALNEFAVLYNGPHCGASAPDHLHFQAGIKGNLPLEQDLGLLPENQYQILVSNISVRIMAVENQLCRFIVFESAERDILTRSIDIVIQMLKNNTREEPMMNMLVWFESGIWQVVLFPRILQRPYQYFAEGPGKLLVSPAAVELGGLVILPREEDFNKITSDDLTSIFNQVTIQADDFKSLKKKIEAQYN
jgi:hypothetical protein